MKALRRRSKHSGPATSKMKAKHRTKKLSVRFKSELRGGMLYLYPKPVEGEGKYVPLNENEPQVFLDMCVQVYRPGDADIKKGEAKRLTRALEQHWEEMYDICDGLLIKDWEKNDE